MAKVTIVRDHLNYKTGDTPTHLNDDQINYLVALGVAQKGKVDSPALKQKLEVQEQAQEEKEAKEAEAQKAAAPKKSAPKKSSKK